MKIGLVPSSHVRLNFSFKPTNHQSSLNPLPKPSNEPLQSIQKHLSNLKKLLQTQPSSKSTLSSNNSGSKEKEKENKMLNGLDLSKIFPHMKAAEEMSPRNLNRLKRLLSFSQEYSPRNSLASRWKEYHGCSNWANLLDPLDENLRHEVVKYGELVQAAYQAFQSNPSTASEYEMPPLSPQHVALPGRSSYKVTKSLYATSSISLPNWVDEVAPDLSWLTQRSSWVGFVAVCDDQREIARMGRRDIVISLRGTSTCLEWVENVRDLLVKVPGNMEHGHAKVECGFLSLYKTPPSIPGLSSLSDAIVEEIRRLMDTYKGETLSISITGHSLGAALALLAADELSTCDAHMPPIAVYSFGGPRVGNRSFGNRITKTGVKVLRIVNSQDMITRVPGMFVNETLDRKLRTSNAASLLQVLDDNMPWAYTHVGSELMVDSKMSPYLKPNADVACCHDLEAYLHLVDGFRASDCPFRANAKRSLVRLLQEQGSNVKKLYTRKAQGL